ncbi:DUF3035 domain-containing protein [Aestuariicoccus sp. MJ-SS9]|uniref:DUF3035 domain-containing protein n=1 Tax=Aestuariicoccus sp. MJ-SS9 TaxID=3079855 RepID=UPI0029096377|nr:DUF3035 domain-containing protein [Aestuariicoccus sp. MJ-SS9]MDU8911338.1 DUF3035 domain-containing protein [Aestuariicoccus sp. MJ-SS9]
MPVLRALFLLSLMGLAACGGRERDITLHDLRTNSREPEEFSIVPSKPLATPESFAELPGPTPGRANRADQTPLSDAVAALGGNPARLRADGVPASDGALIQRAGRFGVDGNIREDLAAADLEFRKTRSRFTFSIVPEDDYYRIYRRQAIDPYRQLLRFRRLGVQTPSAPPEE